MSEFTMNHSTTDREDWQYEVANGLTELGLAEWIMHPTVAEEQPTCQHGGLIDTDGTVSCNKCDYCADCKRVTEWSGEVCAKCGRVWGTRDDESINERKYDVNE